MTVGEPELCSVIVPAYQSEAYLARAIDSALEQTYNPLEVVVVNDGSTDRTGEVARSYGSSVQYVEQENRGLSGARNTAIHVARGDYIALLDSDDWWLPDRMEKCIALLRERPDLTVVTTDAWIFEDGAPTGERFSKGRPFPMARQIEALVAWNYIWIGIVARRGVFADAGTFDERFQRCEDREFFFRVLKSGGRFGCVEEPLAYYLRRSDSLSAAAVDMTYWRHEGLLRHLHGFADLDPKGLGAVIYQVAKHALRTDRPSEAASLFRLASRDVTLPRWSRLRIAARAGVARLGA